MFTKPKYYGTPEYNTVCERLKEVAKKGGSPIGYDVIFEIMKLKPGNYGAKEAGQMLGEVSNQMHSNGKPMLSELPPIGWTIG